jgi:hypothetical protein
MRRSFGSGRHPQHDQFSFVSCWLVQISRGIGLEFFRTTRAAEVEFPAAVLVNIFCRHGTHVHPADRIFFQNWGGAGSSGVGGRHRMRCYRVRCMRLRAWQLGFSKTKIHVQGPPGLLFGRLKRTCLTRRSRVRSPSRACPFDCRYTILDSAPARFSVRRRPAIHLPTPEAGFRSTSS